MTSFLTDLEPAIFWYIAIGASIVFVIQTILTFLSIGGDDMGDSFGGDSDMSSAPFQLFSFRNLVNFLLGFGWGGVSLSNLVHNDVLLIILSFVIGLIFIAVFFVVMRMMWKLAENNSFKMEDTVNKTAEVYLPIPPNREGKGKILVSVKGTVHELSAITDSPDKIQTGKLVTILSIHDSLVVVAPV